MKNPIAVLGAGSWGTALAVLLAHNGHEVNLWARNQEQCATISADKENKKYLPGVIIPDQVSLCNNIQEALSDTEFIVSAVPSHSVREIAQSICPYVHEGTIIINTAKGFEPKTHLRLSQVLKEELPDYCHDHIALLSGPSHAEEVGKNLPTALVVAGDCQSSAEKVQDIFMNRFFRVYINLDLIGVELAGALKNVIALGTGISDGLGYGDNTKAALITRGLAEITRLGVSFGADDKTFSGLAGLGDLVVTCTSMHSRNRRAGIQIGQGKPLKQVLSNMGMVVEGVNTTEAAHHLARQAGVIMPITEQMFQVLFHGKDPENAVISLMTRSKTHEGEGEMLSSGNDPL
ncbi:NAD(P)H-dependent glycerol-3-phosphate dehydrogenase [Dehalobacterium formicoaceticum]|uniref:Glycerol-3-phosphate dehydrogenase [NAD(P)+] n=1 Tax=Dehalobacterium formicoaceticum TaxID=51515 RepID=A0ABT1Y4S9_9FIRM|nr:NAD(P)H-dependent glycerol-3-phosphate dehydrogenase [Dehalobacterium formicoaceticum]MCR6545882.1 NAD(P)H-dependent glycerol-3-phosphate dehydrogenase [Dehalobacterium formicoaceticum]